MCGFAGSFYFNNNNNAKQFLTWTKQCSKLLEHRGPDAEGFFVNDFLSITSRRLRIHDLNEKADQPFKDPQNKYLLAFNGSIFNYLEIRGELRSYGVIFTTDSDTEVVMYALAIWGEKALEKFDGMFSIVFYNKVESTIIIARDKLGIKPLYYFLDKDKLIFSSEIKPIIKHPLVKKEFNKEVVEEFFAFQSLMPPNTFFKNIKVLEPGKLITIDIENTKKALFKVYWDLINCMHNNDNDLNVDEQIIASLEKCWRADRNIGIQLSGGIDSSLISAISKNELKINSANTFSVIFDDSKIKYYKPRSEEKYIDEIANKFGYYSYKYTFKDTQIKSALAEAIWYNEMPINGPSTSLYLLLAKEIKKHTTVLLTGEGADDIFLGYFNNWNFNKKNALFKEFVNSQNILELFGKEGMEKALSTRDNLIDNDDLKIFNKKEQASYVTIKSYLHGLLARHDRMFMASGIEGRLPFCSNNIIQSRFGLPDNLIHHNNQGKVALKNLALKYFDSDFVYRKKIGFSSPFGDWCADNNYWRNYYNFLPEDFFDDLIRNDFLKKHRSLVDNKYKWSEQNLNIVFSFINLYVWYQIYFESSDCFSESSWKKIVENVS